jgi:hypothetical protein
MDTKIDIDQCIDQNAPKVLQCDQRRGKTNFECPSNLKNNTFLDLQGFAESRLLNLKPADIDSKEELLLLGKVR